MKASVKENSEEAKMKKQDEKVDQKKKNEAEIEKKENKKFEKAKGKSKKVEKEVKNMGEYKKKKWILPVSIVSVLVIAIFFSTIFAFVNINNEKIINGISIAGIDVSGLSKEEAKVKIDDIYQNKKEREIEIQYQDYEATLNPTLMEVNYEIEKSLEEAFLIGRGDNIFINNYDILFSFVKKRNIDVNMTLNEEVTKQSIEDIGVNLPGVIIESSYAVEEDELIITKGKEGVSIQTEELLTKVKRELLLKQKNYYIK